MKDTKETYLAPAVEVMEVAVECGFSGSNMESIKDPNAPIGW